MKRLVLALLLVGCADDVKEKKPAPLPGPTVCYKLGMCKVRLNGTTPVKDVNSSSYWPTFNVFCVYGYDAKGKMNGVVERFLTRDAVSAWSQFHPEAKGCE